MRSSIRARARPRARVCETIAIRSARDRFPAILDETRLDSLGLAAKREESESEEIGAARLFLSRPAYFWWSAQFMRVPGTPQRRRYKCTRARARARVCTFFRERADVGVRMCTCACIMHETKNRGPKEGRNRSLARINTRPPPSPPSPPLPLPAASALPTPSPLPRDVPSSRV